MKRGRTDVHECTPLSSGSSSSSSSSSDGSPDRHRRNSRRGKKRAAAAPEPVTVAGVIAALEGFYARAAGGWLKEALLHCQRHVAEAWLLSLGKAKEPSPQPAKELLRITYEKKRKSSRHGEEQLSEDEREPVVAPKNPTPKSQGNKPNPTHEDAALPARISNTQRHSTKPSPVLASAPQRPLAQPPASSVEASAAAALQQLMGDADGSKQPAASKQQGSKAQWPPEMTAIVADEMALAELENRTVNSRHLAALLGGCYTDKQIKTKVDTLRKAQKRNITPGGDTGLMATTRNSSDAVDLGTNVRRLIGSVSGDDDEEEEEEEEEEGEDEKEGEEGEPGINVRVAGADEYPQEGGEGGREGYQGKGAYSDAGANGDGARQGEGGHVEAAVPRPVWPFFGKNQKGTRKGTGMRIRGEDGGGTGSPFLVFKSRPAPCIVPPAKGTTNGNGGLGVGAVKEEDLNVVGQAVGGTSCSTTGEDGEGGWTSAGTNNLTTSPSGAAPVVPGPQRQSTRQRGKSCRLIPLGEMSAAPSQPPQPPEPPPPPQPPKQSLPVLRLKTQQPQQPHTVLSTRAAGQQLLGTETDGQPQQATSSLKGQVQDMLAHARFRHKGDVVMGARLSQPADTNKDQRADVSHQEVAQVLQPEYTNTGQEVVQVLQPEYTNTGQEVAQEMALRVSPEPELMA